MSSGRREIAPEVSVGGQEIVQRCGQGGGPADRRRRPPAGRVSHAGDRRAGQTQGRTGDGNTRGQRAAVGGGRPCVRARGQGIVRAAGIGGGGIARQFRPCVLVSIYCC